MFRDIAAAHFLLQTGNSCSGSVQAKIAMIACQRLVVPNVRPTTEEERQLSFWASDSLLQKRGKSGRSSCLVAITLRHHWVRRVIALQKKKNEIKCLQRPIKSKDECGISAGQKWRIGGGGKTHQRPMGVTTSKSYVEALPDFYDQGGEKVCVMMDVKLDKAQRCTGVLKPRTSKSRAWSSTQTQKTSANRHQVHQRIW